MTPPQNETPVAEVAPPAAAGEEQSAQQTLLKYQAILENASVGIAFTRDRRIEHANPRFEEIFGWPRGALAGQPGSIVWRSREQYERISREFTPKLSQGLPVDLKCMMSTRDGREFHARIRAKPIDPADPIAGGTIWIIEDVSEHEHSVQALKRAHDELEARIRERTAELANANVKLTAEVAERQAAEQRITHLAHHDELTGLPNRRLLEDRLNEALASAQRSGRNAAVMFIDLDRFKTINDSLGHGVGDALLQAVSQRLRDGLRPSDTVSRFGGDEFVLVLPGVTGRDGAVQLANRVLEELSRPYLIAGHELRVTPSLGISMYPTDATSAQALLDHADTAMYHAKAQGPRCFQFFSAAMRQVSTDRFDLESDLHRALARDEFLLHFQPRFGLACGRMRSSEALARWRHPERGMVSPAQFIPLAEETGLIHPIGEWVLREACVQLRRWRDAGVHVPEVSVNLSAHQFRRRGLPELLRAVTRDAGIAASMLEVEITESALMHNTEETLDTLRQMVALGVKISIDDFGTGYSSLAYLKRFPVDLLKIDQSFVRDIHTDPDDATIVRAIAGLARSLGMRVVAEGVETPEQLAFLKEIGCDEVQGYLLSRPMPAHQVPALLTAQPAAVAS